MVLINNVLRGNSLVQRFDGDRDPVFVGTTDEDDIGFVHPEKPDIDISGDIYSGQVTDMDRAVGIGQGGGNGKTFETGRIAHNKKF